MDSENAIYLNFIDLLLTEKRIKLRRHKTTASRKCSEDKEQHGPTECVCC